MKKINENNQKFDQGLVTFRLGINQFADLDSTEFVTVYLNGLRKQKAYVHLK